MSFGPASSDRALIALVSTNSAAVAAVSAVSIGGVSAVRQVKKITTGMSAEIWIAPVPTGTSGSVVLSTSNGSVWDSCVGLYSVTGLLDLTASATDTGGAPGDTSFSMSVAVSPLGVVVGVGDNNIVSSNITWTNMTRDYFLKYTNAASGASFSATASQTLSTTITFAGSSSSCAALASFR
jgi:hypothetical protein